LSKNDFLKILEDKEKFSLNLIKELNSTILSYGKKVVNPKVEFNPEKNTVT